MCDGVNGSSSFISDDTYGKGLSLIMTSISVTMSPMKRMLFPMSRSQKPPYQGSRLDIKSHLVPCDDKVCLNFVDFVSFCIVSDAAI